MNTSSMIIAENRVLAAVCCPMSRPLAGAAWSVRTGPLRIWPGRAICRGQVILARLGDAAAVRRRILLVWSAHVQIRVQVTTGRPSQ